MPLQIRKSVQQMVLEASKEIETLTVGQARALLGRPGVTFIDLRDPRELWREGGIPGAVNVPRGMLEFWIDPASPYHKSFFASGDRFVLFCGGGWRSALGAKTAQDMGLTPVCHIEGGFGAWKSAGAPVETVEPKPLGGRDKRGPASPGDPMIDPATGATVVRRVPDDATAPVSASGVLPCDVEVDSAAGVATARQGLGS